MSLSIPGLDEGQLERLALLSEELGEAQQAIGKILRHGYENHHPTIEISTTNRMRLEKELGHVENAISLLVRNKDISNDRIIESTNDKVRSFIKWTYYQDKEVK